MDGIEKMIGRIREDAQKEIDGVLAEAKQQAAEITAAYARQAEAECEAIVARGEKAAAEREERLGAVSQLESRKEVLAAKQEVIEEAFGLALKKLLALPEEQYVALLADLAVEAAKTGSEKLVFSEENQTLGAKVVAAANAKLPGGKLTLSEEKRPVAGGFILSDGAIEVNCTFDTLIRLERGALAGQVAKVLFD